MDFQNFQKSNFVRGKYLKTRKPQKFGPDRFSRLDVYWIQTDRQAEFIQISVCNAKFEVNSFIIKISLLNNSEM